MSLVLSTNARVERIATDDELLALRDDWNRLAGDMPLLRFEWLATWWRHYRGAQDDLCVVAVYDESEQLMGLAPWYLARGPREGHILRQLGSGEVCTDYLTLLAADGAGQHVAAGVADWLAQQARDDWERLELVGVAADDPTMLAFTTRLSLHGYDVHAQPGLSCWRLDFPQTWEQYLMTLSKSRRERVRQMLRRAFDAGRVATGQVQDPSELEFYFARLVELHQKRRESLGQRGCFASERFTAFHRDVMRQMLAAGLLRLWWTDLDGRPAAIEYDLIGGETVYFYQSGIEPDLAEHRPGWLGAIGSLHDALHNGYRSFDFLRGDEAYKASWGAKERRTVEWRVVAPRTGPRLRHATWSAMQSARRMVRRGWRSIQRHGRRPLEKQGDPT